MRMMLIGIGWLAVFSAAAAQEALPAPSSWQDPETGCAYLLTAQGGITPRLRRDGLPDCPRVSPTPGQEGAASRDDVRDLARTIGTLALEIDRLRRELSRRR
jgi:hypothetical protein